MSRARLGAAVLLVALATPARADTATPQSDPSAVGRAVLSAIDAGELTRAAEWLDDSFQLHYQGVPDPFGKREFLDLLRLNLAAFPDMRHDVAHALPSGEYVTLRVTVVATHRGEYEGVAATGRRVSAEAIHVLHVGDLAQAGRRPVAHRARGAPARTRREVVPAKRPSKNSS